MAMHVTDMLDSVISACYGRFAVPGSVRRNGLEPSNRILVFASPRGGSTWLSEVLGLMDSAVVVSEPFKKGKVKEIEALGFTWHQPIPADARWPESLDSVGAILNLRSVPRELYSTRQETVHFQIVLRPSHDIMVAGTFSFESDIHDTTSLCSCCFPDAASVMERYSGQGKLQPPPMQAQ